MQWKQRGFTMIELIVVIVILGILAAVAFPRFTNMQRDARIAKLNAARGAVQSASAMIHGAWLVRSGAADTVQCPGTTVIANNNNTLCTELGIVNIVNGYPQATLTGIVAAAGLTSVSPPTAAALATEGYSTTGGGGAIGSVLTIRVNGGTDVANCSFTYSPSNGGAAGSAAQVSAITTTGC